MATNVSTIGSGQDYATVELWEADTDDDLISAGDIEEGHLVDDLTTTADIDIAGATTDASNYRVLRPDAGNKYDALAGTGRSFTLDTEDTIEIAEKFLKIRDLLFIRGSVTTAGALNWNTGSDDGLCERCFIRSIGGDGIHVVGTASSIEIFNCIFDGTDGDANGAGIRTGSTASADLYNCTFYNWTSRGVKTTSGGTVNIRNIAATDSGFDFDVASSGTESHNLSSDTTAPGTSEQHSKSTANTFNDAGSDDFTLKATGAAHNNGVDLSGSVSDDFDENPRSGTWDIGAYVSPLPVAEQEGFRFRMDNGSESAAGWLAAQDTNISGPKLTITRLRTLIDYSEDPKTETAALQYRKVGDADTEWRSVPL